MPDFEWPDHLVERIATRDFVLVIGAGVSASCRNAAGDGPVNWVELLTGLNDALGVTARDRDQVRRLIKASNLLDAAELIRSYAVSAGRENDFLNRIRDAVDGPQGNHFEPGALHESLLRLDPGIVVTTNYDRLWERASSSGYALQYYYSENLARTIRNGTPILIKMHGSLDDLSQLILTRSDFARVRQRGAHAFAALQALFMTRTVFFVGYGFADPDIQLVLEDVVGPQGGPPSHYWFTGDDMPAHRRAVMRHGYGVEPLFHPAGDYSQAQSLLDDLASRVEAQRLLTRGP